MWIWIIFILIFVRISFYLKDNFTIQQLYRIIKKSRAIKEYQLTDYPDIFILMPVYDETKVIKDAIDTISSLPYSGKKEMVIV
jgi:cellulose synthase/poly-beta-1,6-N-acetylglucosamine synthase-like glycosyltransferase